MKERGEGFSRWWRRRRRKKKKKSETTDVEGEFVSDGEGEGSGMEPCDSA